MSKTKKKATKEEKLAKDRLRKKLKYAEIKADPEKYRLEKEKEKRKYLVKKEKKNVLSITEMTARQKREQRRRWRKNSKKYLIKLKEQKKLQRILIDNSPPTSETEEIINIPDPTIRDPLMLTKSASCQSTPKSHLVHEKPSTSSATRKLRYRCKKVITNLHNEINKLKKEKAILRKQIFMERKLQKDKIQDTIEKKVDEIIKDIKTDKIQEVKKKLLFNETVSRGVSEKYKSLRKKEKRSFAEDIIDHSRLKKYGILSNTTFAMKNKLSEKKIQENKTAKAKQSVQNFLQEDENSQMAPGKNEFIKKGGMKKQKRYLTDNMKNLHVKYCQKWGRMSYSVFCKYRPFWIIPPSSKRDTCQCKLHSNIELLIKSLKKANIITENSSSEVLNNLCCSVYDRNCLERTCTICKNKVTAYQEFDNRKTIVYHEWIFEKQGYIGKDGKERNKRVTLKKKKEDTPRNIIIKFETLLTVFFKHILNITMQYSAIKNLQRSLSPNEVICHIDFSENYLLKYNEEIQSFHFGGSRQQISLHTGVLYFIDHETKELTHKSFCTVSENIKHDASAIWAHLQPVLKMAQELVPLLTEVHFLSDSPASQYRNRHIFYMMTKLKEQVATLKLISWNYQEAGHGKGAPDGIGAVVKRTADNHVRFGGDVATFENFVQIVQQNVKHVELIIIPEEEILRRQFLKNLPAFKGTNKVHQALWTSSLPFDIALRSLSCFTCRDSYVPCKHGKHLGVLNVGLFQKNTTTAMPSSTSNNHDDVLMKPLDTDETGSIPDSFQNLINSDSPTIFENIGDLRQLDSTEILNSDIIVENSPKIKILSNIAVNYQRFKSHSKNSLGFSSVDQTEFEKFVHQRPKLQNFEDIIDPIRIEYNLAPLQDTSNITELADSSYVALDKENIEASEHKYNIDDWVVVEYKIKKKSNYFIGKIINRMQNTEYKILFLRKNQGKSKKFGWPVISDDDLVPESRILHRLDEPEELRRGQFIFKNLPNINFK